MDWQLLKTLNIQLPYDWEIILLGIYLDWKLKYIYIHSQKMEIP